ncbi:type 1 periplasmic binding fold superfamily protein [Flagellimonas sp. DF-77]|uniref:type 1 periplasmic binding fold superfamily protein n=1 Tax=Flagellimonas algarum TaxID=3230298 RepID=UPI003396DDD2
MKTIKLLSLFALSGLLFTACSDDDDTPEEVNEEEVITTMTVTLVPQGGGDTITLQTQDLDGDGPNAPEVTVSGALAGNTTYAGAIVLLNETESPAENITLEVAEEDDEHQFFFETTGSISNVLYGDADGDGNPLGLAFTMATTTAGSASITITLRHEPKKPNDGTLADAGGETDITETFTLTVQ